MAYYTCESRWQRDLNFDRLQEIYAGRLGEAEERANAGLRITTQHLYLWHRHLQHLQTERQTKALQTTETTTTKWNKLPYTVVLPAKL